MSAKIHEIRDAQWERLRQTLRAVPRNALGRFDALDPPRRELAIAEAWLAAAGEINGAYSDQRAGLTEYRLDGADVAKLNRYAAWRHYEAAERVWKREPANLAAEATYRSALAASPQGRQPDLPPEVAIALHRRPARPTCQPLMEAEMPEHWPPMLVTLEGAPQLPSWSMWVAEYLRGVRARRGNDG